MSLYNPEFQSTGCLKNYQYPALFSAGVRLWAGECVNLQYELA